MAHAFLNSVAIAGKNLLEAGQFWPLVNVKIGVYSLDIRFHEGKAPNKLHENDPRFVISIMQCDLLECVRSIKPDDFYFKPAGKNPVGVWRDFQMAAPAVQLATIRHHIDDLLDPTHKRANLRPVSGPIASVA